MLIVLHDEHGGYYDHVAPPPARTTGSKGRDSGFTFDRCGPRVPAVIVSPLIPRNLIDHRHYEHSSVISTLIDLFHLGPLTARSTSSSGLTHLARSDSGSGLMRLASLGLDAHRDDAPMTLPEPMGGAVARIRRVPFAESVAERPDAALTDDPNGSIAAVVRAGLSQHLQVAPAGEHEAIMARVKALTTRGEALGYLKQVLVVIEAARAKAGVRRSAVVRARR